MTTLDRHVSQACNHSPRSFHGDKYEIAAWCHILKYHNGEPLGIRKTGMFTKIKERQIDALVCLYE